jgi:hypothetical protein
MASDDQGAAAVVHWEALLPWMCGALSHCRNSLFLTSCRPEAVPTKWPLSNDFISVFISWHFPLK